MIDQAEIHNQCFSEDPNERIKALFFIKNNLSLLPDKQQAWNYLIKLVSDQNFEVKLLVATSIDSVFSDVPDKQQACNDLIKLVSSEDDDVRAVAANLLCHVSSDVPDKQLAWNELIKLRRSQEARIRFLLPVILGSFFSYIQDKQKALNDLIRFISDQNIEVRIWAVNTIGSVFSDVPDKQLAWNELVKVTNDEDYRVKYFAVKSLGSVFSQVPDKNKSWSDLIRLTNNENSFVRSHVNYALGKASIFKASQVETEEEYKDELENAICFFEKSSLESDEIFANPSRFCLPFYRSFHTIIFKKQEAKEEVDRYLAEAKSAIEDSKSKELLFETVESLAYALKEVQQPENLDLQTMKGELNFYRKYCDHAEQLLRDNEEIAPFAVGTIKRGLPILDKNLKDILKGVQEKTRAACKELQGTYNGEIACTINRKIQRLGTSSPDEASQNIDDIAFTLKSQVPNIPEYILNKIDLMISENDLIKKTQILSYVTSYIIGQMLKENQTSIRIDGNATNLIVNSKDSSINVNTENKKRNKSGFIDSFATRASFLGFIVLELLNIWRPLGSTNHIICLLVIVIFFILAFKIYNKDIEISE